MKQKKFLVVRLWIVMALAFVVSSSVTAGNYILPIIAFITAAGIMYIARSKVKDVMVDERDIKISGKASRISYSVYAISAALLGAVLIALGKNNPALLPIGYTLSFSTCVLLLIYVVSFKYYESKGDS